MMSRKIKIIANTVLAMMIIMNHNALSADADKKDPVVFKSNKHKLTLADIKAAYGARPEIAGKIPFETAYYILLQEMGLQLLFKDEAIKQGLDKDPRVVKDVEKAKAHIYMTHLQKKILSTAVTEKKLKALYEKHKKEFTKSLVDNEQEANISRIIVKTKEEADQVLKKLETRGFETVAKESSSTKKVKLGWFRRGELGNEIGDAVFKLSAGSHSKIALKTPFGFTIVKCNGFRKAAPKPFDKMINQLSNQVNRDTMMQFKDKIQRDSGAVFYDETGTSTVDPSKKLEKLLQGIIQSLMQQKQAAQAGK